MLLQFQVVILKLSLVYLTNMSDVIISLCPILHHQNVDEVLLELSSVGLFEVLIEGGVLFEGQVIDEKDDFDVGVLFRVKFILAEKFKGVE